MNRNRYTNTYMLATPNNQLFVNKTIWNERKNLMNRNQKKKKNTQITCNERAIEYKRTEKNKLNVCRLAWMPFELKRYNSLLLTSSRSFFFLFLQQVFSFKLTIIWNWYNIFLINGYYFVLNFFFVLVVFPKFVFNFWTILFPIGENEKRKFVLFCVDSFCNNQSLNTWAERVT